MANRTEHPVEGEVQDEVQPKPKPTKKAAPAKKAASGKAPARAVRAGGWVIRDGRPWALNESEGKGK